MELDNRVKQSLEALSESIAINGPYETECHQNYIISGLCDNARQIENLCWVLLSFIGEICTKDFEIISTIKAGLGKDTNLKTELCRSMTNNWLIPANDLPTNKRENRINKNRNPLIFELITHAIFLLQKENPELAFAGAVPIEIRPPHISANETGIDLIAIMNKEEILPLIGEMKAYETNPAGGLIDACKKFNDVNGGKHNPEIRSVLRDGFCNYPNEKLSQNIWENKGLFSAVIGSGSDYSKELNFTSRSEIVKNVECQTLFFISTPFKDMSLLFENITQVLYTCVDELVE